jgi:hypothetical protein
MKEMLLVNYINKTNKCIVNTSDQQGRIQDFKLGGHT